MYDIYAIYLLILAGVLVVLELGRIECTRWHALWEFPEIDQPDEDDDGVGS